MAQKWYQKATVQVAIVGGLFLLTAALIPVALEVPGLKSDNASLAGKLSEKTAEVLRLETQLAPFRTIALERYTGPENEALTKLATQIQLLQELDAQKNSKIEELQKGLDKTSEQARPPILTLASYDTVTNGEARVVTLLFKPSKNQPLGTLKFVVGLEVGSAAEITDFWPAKKSGAFQSGKDSKMIAENRKAARLIYSLLSADWPKIDLTLSAPTTFSIRGEYIAAPIILEVK